MSREQNLEARMLALVVLGTIDRKLLESDPAPVVAAVERATPGSFQRLAEQLARPRKRLQDSEQ